VIEERQNGTGTSNVSYQYVWGLGGSDQLVLRDTYSSGTRTARYYAQWDANDNFTSLISTAGAVVERYLYDPYGSVTYTDASYNTRSSSSYAWRYLNETARLDTITGWYGMRSRDYIPSEGRWAERDPLSYGAGDMNLYRFVANRPTSLSDPSGLDWQWYDYINPFSYLRVAGQAISDKIFNDAQVLSQIPETGNAIDLKANQRSKYMKMQEDIYYDRDNPPDKERPFQNDYNNYMPTDVGQTAQRAAQLPLDVAATVPGGVPKPPSGRTMSVSPSAVGGSRAVREAEKSAKETVAEAAPVTRGGRIRNQHLAGNTHPITGVPFDSNGFPVFDSAFDATIPQSLRGPSVTDASQFRNATQQLNKKLQQNPALRQNYTQAQLDAIAQGAERVPGYIWHHNQDGVTLQLVEAETHSLTGHSGGRQMTGGRP
jgi:RHS repeat-associated protein